LFVIIYKIHDKVINSVLIDCMCGRTAAALAMVNAMMNALEKSKSSLTELSAEEDHLIVSHTWDKQSQSQSQGERQGHGRVQLPEREKQKWDKSDAVYNVDDNVPETLGADDRQEHDYMSESSTHFTEDAFDRYTSAAPVRQPKDQNQDRYATHDTPTSYAHSARPLAASRLLMTSDLRDENSTSRRYSADFSTRPRPQTILPSPSKVRSPSYYRERFDSPPLEAPFRAATESSSLVETSDTELDLSDGGYGGTTDHKPHYFMLSRHHDRNVKKTTTAVSVSKQSVHSVRKAKGMPRVMRICVSPGAQVKVCTASISFIIGQHLMLTHSSFSIFLHSYITLDNLTLINRRMMIILCVWTSKTAL
jgi:hypothetical protein